VTTVIAAFRFPTGPCLQIARECTHPFDKLLASGLTCLLGLQAFIIIIIIIAGVTRLLPLTGVALPFVTSTAAPSLTVRLPPRGDRRDSRVVLRPSR